MAAREKAGWTFTIEPGGHYVEATLTGWFEADDWLRLLRELPRTPGFRPGMGSLHDIRAAGFDFRKTEVARVVDDVSDHVERRGSVPYRAAFVVSRDVEFGITRMILAWSDKSPFEGRAFRDIEEARRWLVEGDRADPSAGPLGTRPPG